MDLRTTRIILPALVGLLVLVAGCLGGAPLGPATATEGDLHLDGPSISVSASGQVEAAPDLAVVSVAVEARADTADAARDQVAQAADRMRAALRSTGITDEQVTTTGYYLTPEYDYSRDGDRDLIGYRAVHLYRIETGVDAAGDAIDTAVANGATSVNGVQFTLSDERRQDLRAEALTAAMENARGDAEAIATAGGLSITGTHTVSTNNVGYSPYPYFDRAEAGGDGASAPTVIEPGTVTVSATVSVVYTAN